MHSFTASSHLSTPTIKPSSATCPQCRPSSSGAAPCSATVKCHLPSQNPKPKKCNSLIHSSSKPLALASASTATLLIRFSGGGGGGDGSSGNFWEKHFLLLLAIADNNNQTQEWDSHGLPPNIVVQLNKLSGFKKYKLLEILFFDRPTIGTEDSFFEMVSLRPGGIYTKTQLQKELETLATGGMFEKVDMEGKTSPMEPWD